MGTTTARLSENSRLGFDGIKAAVCLGSMTSNSNTASGLQPRLRRKSIRTRYTGQIRDFETGLDYFGARYYSSPLGRFTSPDPLYVEARRLADPQQINLYAYVRNNPLKFRDPTGMDLKLDCDTPENCDEAVRMINSRNGGQFAVELGKNNTLQIMKGSMGSNLSAAETALLNAITDGSNHAILEVYGDTGKIDFGVYMGVGKNSVDIGNLRKLDGQSNRPGISSSDVVVHESLEAYFSLFTGNGPAAHNQVIGLPMPGLTVLSYQYDMDPSRTILMGDILTYGFSDRSGSMRVTTRLVTPIPEQSLIGLPSATVKSTIESAPRRVQEVQYVP